MADIRITDLVDEKVFSDLQKLQEDIKTVKEQYVAAATELAKGLKMNITVTGDLEKLNQVVAENARRAQQATEQLNTTIDKQREIVAQTTNTISRELAEIEKENKAKREAFDQDKSALDIAESLLGTRAQNIQRLAQLQGQLKDVKKAQKDLDDQEKAGTVSAERATAVRASLIAKQREYQAAIKDLNLVLTNQEKQMQASDGSYQKLSLQLEFLKKAYKGLTDEEKSGELGKQLGEEIGNLDAHLKDLAADMGEFQRNTGNYAIANQSVKTELKELVQEIALLTVQYRNMSEEEQKSAQGKELEEKIRTMTVEASDLKDAIGDVNAAIGAETNDTKNFTAISDGINLVISGMGGLTAASHALGVGEKDLIKVQTTLQASLAASNALTKAQAALQKESALMSGVARVQEMAHAAAIKMKTAAESESVIVSKAATVAQKAFNAVARANPYVILATGIGLVVSAIIGFTKTTKKETEEQKAAREEMERSKKEYEDFINVEKRLQDAREKGINSCADEITKLQLLYTAATDTTRSLDDRKKAVDKLQELYPSYFANINDEIILNGKAEQTYKNLANAILQKAIAEGKQKVLTEYTEEQARKERELLDVMNEQAEAQERLRKAKEAYNKAMEERNTVDQTPWAFSPEDIADARLRSVTDKDKTDATKEYEEAKANVEELGNKVVKLGTEINDAKKAAKELAQSMSMDEILNAVGGSGGGGGTTTTTSNETKETAKTQEEIKEIILENSMSIIAEKIKLTEKGSKEEYDLTLKYIEAEQMLREIEISKTYDKQKHELDKSLKEQKITQEEYNEAVLQLESSRADSVENMVRKTEQARLSAAKEYSEAYIDTMEKAYAKEQELREINLMQDITALTQMRAGQNISEEEYQARLAELQQKYAEETAEKQIEMLEKVLEAEELTADQRAEISKELAKIKTKAAKDSADAELKVTKNVEKEEEKAEQQREKNVKKFLQEVSKMVGKVNKLVSTIYDRQIEDIETQQEAAEKAHDAEIERIETLEETGAITKEEAEARKMAAEQRSAEKNEELEKKKAEIKHKQAVWDKAASISEAIIATSLGVAEALKLMWPMNLIIAALVGAMGAVEIATIAATPIPAYAKGTKGKDGHPGGLALVGDAGKKEAVFYNEKMWITPDTPTLVDMPKGAIVYPDADRLPEPAFMTVVNSKDSDGKPIVIVSHDSKKMERGLEKTNLLLKKSILMQKKIAYDAAYANYKNTRL